MDLPLWVWKDYYAKGDQAHAAAEGAGSSIISLLESCEHPWKQPWLLFPTKQNIAIASNGAPMGLQWGEMGKNNLGDFGFFLFFNCICGFMGLYYSKMANSGPRTYCNTFGVIWGTSKIWSKSGPVDLLSITKMLQKIREQLWEHPGNIYIYMFCQFGTHKILFFLFGNMYVLGTMRFAFLVFFVEFRVHILKIFLWR